MHNWETQTVRDLLLEAGHIALHHFDSPETEHKADRSLVTVADHAIEDFLTKKLVSGTDPEEKNVTLLGEETVGRATADTVRQAVTGVTWVVDPIDGTSSYANRLPTWGISIGRMEDGAFTDGALFLPRTGDMFITAGDQVLYQRGTRDQKHWSFEDLKPFTETPRTYHSMGMVSLPHEVVNRGYFDGGNPMQVNASAVYSLATLLLGGYLIYVARIRIWDLAGTIPILRRLGYKIQFADGRELGDRLTADDWILDPEDPGIWKSAGLLYVAHDQQTIDHVCKHYHAGNRSNPGPDAGR